MDKKDELTRGQIWTVPLNGRRRPALVVSVNPKGEGAYVLPVVSQSGPLTISLSEEEMRQPAFVTAEVLKLVPFDAMLHHIGTANPVTMGRLDKLLTEILGLESY